MARETDKFANVLVGKCTTAGATVVNNEITTGISLGEGYGILIDQIDYILTSTVYADFAAGAAGDALSMGWFVQSPSAAADFAYDNSRMLHRSMVYRTDYGAAASGFLIKDPYEYKYDPPLIMASPKIIFSCSGSAAISGGDCFSRLYFRYIKLTQSEYLELAEAFVLLS